MKRLSALILLVGLAGCDDPKAHQKAADEGAQWERRRVLRIVDAVTQKRAAAGNVTDVKLLGGLRSLIESGKEFHP